MSVAFSSVRPRSKVEVTPQTIQKMLDENHHLIQCIMDNQSKGKKAECTQCVWLLPSAAAIAVRPLAAATQASPPLDPMIWVSSFSSSSSTSNSNLSIQASSGEPGVEELTFLEINKLFFSKI
uniref:SS18L1 subunit of BAF chromatin remodeling complex n=1 Tax=Oryzias latipes TaxID=8090 RepID=A0A3P9JC41_ORYLA